MIKKLSTSRVAVTKIYKLKKTKISLRGNDMKLVMQNFGKSARRTILLWAGLLAVAGVPLMVEAFDDIPDYLFYVHMTVPRDGFHPLEDGIGAWSGDIRNTFETTIETYWRETSYHEPDPATGFSEHGFYANSRTLGYVYLPWPVFPEGPRADSYDRVFDDDTARPVTFAGEFNFETGNPDNPNDDPQLYGGNGPMVDGYWTPGERFNDENGNGEWDDVTFELVITPGTPEIPAIDGDNWWNNDNVFATPTNWPGPQELYGYNDSLTASNAPSIRGEMFADYNGNVILAPDGTNVLVVSFESSVNLIIASGSSNVTIQISEFDLTPNNLIPSEEGDFFHEHILDPTFVGPATDIPRNGNFDYMVNSSNGLPFVSQRRDSNFNQPMTLSYDRWMTTNSTVYTGNNGPADNAIFTRIVVPVYQSTELWGNPFQTIGDQTSYQDDNGVFQLGSLLVPAEPDTVTTNVIPAELFEDFISWWVPFAGLEGEGIWLGGVIGPSTIGTPVILANMPNISDTFDNVITRSAYDQYIADNYPGDTTALILRAGNGTYDGPDSWLDTIDNKMQITGYLEDTLSAEPTDYPPLLENWWDPHDWFSSSWTVWWTDTFGSTPPTTYGTPYNFGAWWPGDGIPNTVPIDIPTRPEAGGWIPRLDSTWGYDAPREFQDLPSSIYHLDASADAPRGAYENDPFPNGGDLRLGEVTDPLGNAIYGFDAGASDPGIRASYGEGDGYIPAGGPLAYNGHALFTFDAMNVLSLELATWRTDGDALTGPTNPVVSQGSGFTPILYGGDHRDVNLDGLVDQGETVPAGSQSYFVDDDSSTADSGGSSDGVLYPFNWDRYVEDTTEAWDYGEDYELTQRPQTSGTVDELIHAPKHAFNIPVSGTPLANVVGVATIGSHTNYVVGDSVWIDANTNNIYDLDVALFTPNDFISTGTVGVVLGDVAMHDANLNSVFNIEADNLWQDANSNLIFDAEIVLADSGELVANQVGLPIDFLDTNVVVVYRNIGTGAGFQYGDAVWIENLTGFEGSNAVANAFDETDIVLLSWGDLEYGDTMDATFSNVVFHGPRAQGQPFTRYLHGDSVWIDANLDMEFTAEEALFLAGKFVYPWMSDLAFLPGSSGIIFSGAVAYNEVDGPVGFQGLHDEAWLDQTANGIFDGELVLAAANHGLAGGTVKDFDIPNAHYGDLNGTFAFELVPNVIETFATEDTGDVVWDDVDGDGIYGGLANFRTPLYWVGIHNLDFAPPNPPAGNSFDVHHRDSPAKMSGLMFIVAPDAVTGLLQHEFGHDAHGWPDLYDYDTDLPFGFNAPIGAFDLMAGGGMVHGIPDLKTSRGWVQPVDLTTLVPSGGGLRTIQLWPIERHRHQYYIFHNSTGDGHGSEYFWFWYQSDVQANQFQNFAGAGQQGVHISHTDFGSLNALPPQQRLNNHYTYQIVQADGLYEMEDGVNAGENADVWPGTTGNTLFSADTIPWSRWWSGNDSGLRIVDVRLPADPLGPAEIDVEIFNTSTPWVWPSAGADIDNDGIVDIWEFHYFGGLDVAGATTDWDNDGFSDLGEYLSATDPTSLGGSTDYSDDADGDGLANGDEVEIYGSDPQLADTDDDGIIDSVEVAALSDPIDPLSPLVDRVLELDGTPGTYLELPDSDRFALETWYISAWVKPMATTGEVAIINRQVEPGVDHYFLGLDADRRAILRFNSGTDHSVFSLIAPLENAIPLESWTHIMGSFNNTNHTLELHVNGAKVAWQVTAQRPETEGSGPVFTRVGEGFVGQMDEVQIWNEEPSSGSSFTTVFQGSVQPNENLTAIPATGTALAAGEYQLAYVSGTWEDSFSNTFTSVTIADEADPGTPLATVDALSGPAAFTFSGSSFVAYIPSFDVNLANSSPIAYEIQDTASAASEVDALLDPVMAPAGRLEAYYRFDDGTHTNGTSARASITWGQVHDFSDLFPQDWKNRWVNSGTLRGSAMQVVATKDSPVYEGSTDTDGDMIADWWELRYFGDLTTVARAEDGTYTDFDEDGLTDLFEFLSGLSPRDNDTNNDGVLDGVEDLDGDGLVNNQEQAHRTNPLDADTDDDGIDDLTEVSSIPLSNARYSMSQFPPTDGNTKRGYLPRSLDLSLVGVPGAGITMPAPYRFDRSGLDWTVELRAQMGSDVDGHLISYEHAQGTYQFDLGLNGGAPYLRVSDAATGTNLYVSAAGPIPDADWHRIAARWEAATGKLTFWVDAMVFETELLVAMPGDGDVPGVPAFGSGWARIGADLTDGYIDEVKIWNKALSDIEMAADEFSLSQADDASLLAYYRFDDGGDDVEDFAQRWAEGLVLRGAGALTT
ncbi:MAG: hypothetical protein ACI9OU_001738, partial [Candidatus Promineifilaceae bacterium]